MSRKIECYICGLKDNLHPLPSDPKLAEKWMRAIPNAIPDIFDRTFRLCVNHFDKKFVFCDRHLLKKAYPELFYYNGRNWTRDRSKPGEYFDDARSSTSSPLLDPIDMKPAKQQHEESVVILPLPPRRDDEPESDPLAIPDPPIIKTPVISHVTSLHRQTVRQSRSTPHHTPTENKTTYNSSAVMRQTPKQQTRIEDKISTRSGSKAAARTPTQVLSTATSKPSRLRILPTPANAPSPVVQQSSGQQLLLTQSGNQQFIATASTTNALRNPVVFANQTPGQPIILPDQKFILAPVNANKSQDNILLITNPGTLQPINNSPSIPQRTAPQPSQRATGPLFQPSSNGELPAPRDQAQFQMVNEPVAKPEEQLRSVVEAMPRLKAKRTCDLNAEDTEYAEKLAQEAIATIKTDIANSQQRSRAIQKKINLLRLKVSTYESFIAKLVSRRIISRQSAKECRVLQQDVTRYNKRKHRSGSSLQDDSMLNNKENSNDTIDSFDSSTAKDHDYI